MKSTGKIICQIPARGGSKRVPAKNLRYLCGKPLLSYAIETALQCDRFDEVYVNTDSDVIASLAQRNGAAVYHRPPELGSDTATGDDFTADFLQHIACDTLAMISPVCPFVTPNDIRHAIEVFSESDCDTLISCEATQMQVFCGGKAVNIDASKPLAPSQQNEVVSILNWAVTLWDTRTYLAAYQRNKSGYLGTKRLLHPLDPAHCLKISHESDFVSAELRLQAHQQRQMDHPPPRYWTADDASMKESDCS